MDNSKVVLGLSSKLDGSMKGDLENKKLFFKKESLSFNSVITASLSHKNRVIVISSETGDRIIEDCDALITNQSNIALTVTVADCLAIYFFDPNKNIIAIAHAGWRGVVSNIVLEVLQVFKNKYQSDLVDLKIVIGPHIRDCHFEIQDDTANEFEIKDIIFRDKKKFVNLSSIIIRQLISCGIKNDNILLEADCTYCQEKKYFSYRRDKPKDLQTMVAYILLK